MLQIYPMLIGVVSYLTYCVPICYRCADRDLDGLIARSFGAHERHYLSLELKPLLETLGGVTAGRGGGGGGRGPETATVMAFNRMMEEVRTLFSRFVTAAAKYRCRIDRSADIVVVLLSCRR